MARELSPEAAEAEAEKKRLKAEKKSLKKEQKERKKEAKRRADEIARQEEELGEEGGNGLVTFGATILIIFLWLAVICVVVKLDIGGFGSTVLSPILKDVPVLNRILPGNSLTETTKPDNYGGYSSLQEAVDYIKQLEKDLERAQNALSVKDADIEALKAENNRLKEFETRQADFQRISNEFYREVVYSDKGPGIEEYRKWYEEMNPDTKDFLYKQVILQMEEDAEFKEFAQSYASESMKPKQAAAIFESMTDDLPRVARILNALSAEDRGSILGVMDSEIAAKLTKIMDPDT